MRHHVGAELANRAMLDLVRLIETEPQVLGTRDSGAKEAPKGWPRHQYAAVGSLMSVRVLNDGKTRDL